MSQVNNNTPYTANKSTLAGWRVMISELVSGTNYTGFRFMGTVFAPKWVPKIEYYDHYETGSGANELDRRVPKQVGLGIEFTCDDLFARNFERWFMSTSAEKVAAAPTQVHVPDLVIAGKTGELHGLSEPRLTGAQQIALKVYNVTDSALLVLNTDYKITSIYGNTFVEMMLDTHAGDVLRLGEGATAITDYHFDLKEHFVVAPLTRLERKVRAILQAPAKIGGAWEYLTERATLDNGGDFDINIAQASSMKFTLNMLSNAAADPTYPWGKIRHYGYDDAGTSLL